MTDCTTEGTFIVKDIYEGSSSGPGIYWDHRIMVGDTLYFPASVPGINSAPWKSDGTPEGTVRIPGSEVDGIGVFNEPAHIGDYVYFSANDGATGAEPYRVELTTATAEMIADINNDPTPSTSSSVPREFIAFDGKVFFVANNDNDSGEFGTEIWSYDNEGNVSGFDIRSGTSSSTPSSLTVVGDNLMFIANDGIIGSEPCVLDGAAWECLDINPDGANYSTMVGFNGKAWFDASDGTAAEHGIELWSSDGATTEIAADIWPGMDPSNPTAFTVFGDALYFNADRDSDGRELWRVKDDAVELFLDLYPGSTDDVPNNSNPFEFQVIGDRLYFQADTGDGHTWWSTDGTEEGTLELAASMGQDQIIDPCTSVLLGQMTDYLLILADLDGDEMSELWKTAGTPETTELIENLGVPAVNSCEEG